MSDDALSNNEIEAMLSAAKSSSSNGKPLANGEDNNDKPNLKLSSFADTTARNLSRAFGSFIRKKINTTRQHITIRKAVEFYEELKGQNIFTLFHINPSDCYGICSVSLPLLHQSMNLLYGGTTNANDKTIKTPGKVGIQIAKKIAQISLDCFSEAYTELAPIKFESLKTDSFLDLSTKFSEEENLYAIEYHLTFDAITANILLLFSEKFVSTIDAARIKMSVHIPTEIVQGKDFWRQSLEQQLVDSSVNLSVRLPDIKMKLSDFIKLNINDLIPCSDPKFSYICLNDIKMFRAVIGQEKSGLVAKILSKI